MNLSQETRTAFRTCPLCEATCGLEITLQGNEILRITGDKDDVLSGGYCCPKGMAIGELQNDPDRLRHPLIRRNGSFEEASWDEAYAAVEKGLLPFIQGGNRNAIALFYGNPCAHTLAGQLYLQHIIRALKTINLYSASTTDQMPRHVASGLMFGSPSLISVPDLDRTQYLLILGANPLVSGGSMCTAPGFAKRLTAIRDRGGKIVVIDPAKTRTAKAADEYHPIRPGTDAFLLLAMMHVLFAEELVSLKHLSGHVQGIEEVRSIVQRFSPERASGICGIDTQVIRRIAREFSAAHSAAAYGRIGTNTVSFGSLNAWLIELLNILTGNFGKAGGSMFPQPGHSTPFQGPGGKGWQTGRRQSRVKGYPEVMGEFPVATLADEIETPGEGQIRALLTIAGNPVLSSPNANRLDKALASLDFMVSVDFYLNETTRHADVILPPPGPLNTGHSDIMLYNNAIRNVAHYSPPVLPADPGHPDKWEIMLTLALIVSGQGAATNPSILDDFIMEQLVRSSVKNERSPVHGRDATELLSVLGRRKGPERMLDWMFRTGCYGDGFGKNPAGLSLERLENSPHGIDLGPITPAIPEAIRTPSGKIELAPLQLVEDVKRLETSLSGKTHDLVLIGRRNIRSCNSWLHNLPSLLKGDNRCTLLVHPQDAARFGLTQGAYTRISTGAGFVEVPVEISQDMLQGVVSLPHGWGHNAPESRMAVAKANAGANSNILAAGDIDPLSGNAVLNGIDVEVVPVPDRE